MPSLVSNESPSNWPCTDSGPENAIARCSAPSPRWDVACGFAPHWRSSLSTTTPCHRGMQALYKSGVRPSAFSCSMSQPLPTSRLIKATISSSLMSSDPGRVWLTVKCRGLPPRATELMSQPAEMNRRRIR
jgi:hypothetical protein